MRENDEDNLEHMKVVEVNGGSNGGNNVEVIETEVTDVNKSNGELMICEVSDLHYFSCYCCLMLCGNLGRSRYVIQCWQLSLTALGCRML